ncbi:MAG: hypothetical protein FWG04_00085 [Desulfovibrionaceae bacterium]|nr:hypothetical protein [Desulfovibrionaceae bacterium]
MNDDRKKNGDRPAKDAASSAPGRQGPPQTGKRVNAHDRPDTAGARRGSDAPRRQDSEWTKGATGALIELDRELMKLLVRRATLVSRIRGGRDHAASPAAIQAEKAVRIAWETGALAFSKDPRFARQLFSLLQDIKILSKEQAENTGVFRLAPPNKPVAGSITGPTSTRAAQMRLALAASLGNGLVLERVTLSTALADTIKACTQAGAKISYQHQGALARIEVTQGPPLSFQDKTLYMGEDLFTAYLMAFLAIGSPGISRFTGGSRLKSADLAPLRHILPLFGARLAHVIPHSQSLPANVESSGDIPSLVAVPADLPFEGVCALLLAPLAWNVPLTLDLAALPAAVATAALGEVRPLHREAGADVETRGPSLLVTPAPLTPPQCPALPLDPALSAYLLAIPLFAGGSLRLQGFWPGHMPEAAEAEQLLAWAGGEISIGEGFIQVTAGSAPFCLPLQCGELSPQMGSLYLALKIKHHLLHQSEAPALPQNHSLFSQEEAQECELAQELCARLNLSWNDGVLTEDNEAPAHLPAWSSPNAHWGMAYALCAFLKPGLELANPGKLNEAMPAFWGIYNSLPKPADPALQEPRGGAGGKATRSEAGKERQENTDDKPARRRRIIAD